MLAEYLLHMSILPLLGHHTLSVPYAEVHEIDEQIAACM